MHAVNVSNIQTHLTSCNLFIIYSWIFDCPLCSEKQTHTQKLNGFAVVLEDERVAGKPTQRSSASSHPAILRQISLLQRTFSYASTYSS